MFYIQVTTNDRGIMYWSTGGLMELRWQADKFETRDKVDEKRKQIARENPDWFVQWKRIPDNKTE